MDRSWSSMDIPLDVSKAELLMFLERVPDNATIEYAGCGSHRIEAVWNNPRYKWRDDGVVVVEPDVSFPGAPRG